MREPSDAATSGGQQLKMQLPVKHAVAAARSLGDPSTQTWSDAFSKMELCRDVWDARSHMQERGRKRLCCGQGVVFIR